MVSKEQAQAAKNKLLTLFTGLTVGIGKDGDDHIVSVRGETAPANLPVSLDDVKVSFETTPPVKAMDSSTETL